VPTVVPTEPPHRAALAPSRIPGTFDVRCFGRRVKHRPRVLVVAHSAPILAQAEVALSKVLEAEFGEGKTVWYVVQRSDLFACIQKLSRAEGVERLSQEKFDYIVIDEFHHAHAPSYPRVLAKLQADFILE
jgi:superfamily II DNA or RNA helicase